MNNQQKQAFDALRKKMNEAGVTESEFNEFIEGNNSKRNTTKEQASEAYVKGKLKDHQEYLGCEESRRKQLITCDLYDLEQAFEDGWDEANNTMIDKACKWFGSIDTDKYMDSGIFQMYDLIQDFKKAMEK